MGKKFSLAILAALFITLFGNAAAIAITAGTNGVSFSESCILDKSTSLSSSAILDSGTY